MRFKYFLLSWSLAFNLTSVVSPFAQAARDADGDRAAALLGETNYRSNDNRSNDNRSAEIDGFQILEDGFNIIASTLKTFWRDRSVDSSPSVMNVNFNYQDLMQKRSLRSACIAQKCSLYTVIFKKKRIMVVYARTNTNRDLNWLYQFPVSTGTYGHETPERSGNPNGRIYVRYNSRTYPNGGQVYDSQGRSMGNMPYSVFLFNGTAVHGTPPSPAIGVLDTSMGCIETHPQYAKSFMELVQYYGVNDTWFEIRNE